jgi:hypothetical protein
MAQSNQPERTEHLLSRARPAVAICGKNAPNGGYRMSGARN